MCVTPVVIFVAGLSVTTRVALEQRQAMVNVNATLATRDHTVTIYVPEVHRVRVVSMAAALTLVNATVNITGKGITATRVLRTGTDLTAASSL